MIEAKQLHLQVIVKVFQFFFDGYVRSPGIFKRKTNHFRKFVQVIISVFLFIFQYHLLDAAKAIKNKMRVHLRQQGTEDSIAHLAFQFNVERSLLYLIPIKQKSGNSAEQKEYAGAI